MSEILVGCGLLSVGAITCFVLAHLLRTIPARDRYDELSVAVVVPCKGNDDPGFVENIEKIVAQRYDGPAEFMFVVEEIGDPAVDAIRKLDARHQNVRLCVAGQAHASGQKSFNILRAIQCIGPADVLVVADADIRPTDTWLSELLAPLRDSSIDVATGFFRIEPETSQFGNYISSVLATVLWQGVACERIKGIWGGSMAIRSEVFKELGLEKRLEEEIVDDVMLMHALHLRRRRRAYAPTCLLPSPCDRTLGQAFEWFVRQIQYSQIYFPKIFTLTHMLVFPLAASLAAAPLLVASGIATGAAPIAWGGMIVLGAHLANGIALWPGMPTRSTPRQSEIGLGKWLLAWFIAPTFVAGAMTSASLRVKHGVLTMIWRGITYEVELATRHVISVNRDGGNGATADPDNAAVASGDGKLADDLVSRK